MAKTLDVTMRPEVALILRASAYALGDYRRLQKGNEANWRDLDWPKVRALALRNGVLPLVYSYFTEQLEPNEKLGELETLFRLNAVRSYHITQELVRLVELFKERQIPAIPFKGATLAQQLYGNVAMGQFVDLDFFVKRETLEDVARTLAEAGYVTDFDSRYAVRSDFFNVCETQFNNLKARTVVDLHWKVVPDRLSPGPDVESLIGRAQQLNLNDITIPILAPADHLHVLCIQQCRDGWEKLSAICAVAGLARLVEEDDWEMLTEEASRYGSLNMVLLGLALAECLLDLSLPDKIRQRIRKKNQLFSRLVRDIANRLFTQTNARLSAISQWLQEVLFPVRLIERRQDGIRYLLARALRPTIRDWVFLPMPESLFLLYYLVRPLRLLVNGAGQLAGLFSDGTLKQLSYDP